jgi:hypothetical protein
MLTLDTFEKDLYDAAYAGMRWLFAPREAGEQFALAILVEGQSGEIEIPVDICRSDNFAEMERYVDNLNSELQFSQSSVKTPLISEVA